MHWSPIYTARCSKIVNIPIIRVRATIKRLYYASNPLIIWSYVPKTPAVNPACDADRRRSAQRRENPIGSEPSVGIAKPDPPVQRIVSVALR